MRNDITITGVRVPYIDDVVMPSVHDIEEILSKSPRNFTSRFTFIRMKDLRKLSIRERSGVLLEIEYGKDKISHIVVLWLGADGNFFYFDSEMLDAPRSLKLFVKRQHARLYHLTRRLQGEGCHTCVFHCFAFIDYISQNDLLATDSITQSYQDFLGYLSDARVVQDYK